MFWCKVFKYFSDAQYLKALCHNINCNCFLMRSLVQKLIKVGTGSGYGVVHGRTRKFNRANAQAKLAIVTERDRVQVRITWLS